MQSSSPHYRPDIDGLRAIAVVPVVLYHFNVAGFSGGFVGVDVFFVISGYLITSLIHREIVEQRFSIWTFYERRIRRIFPALFFLLAITTIAALWLLFPADLSQYAKSAFATVFFASNVEFWREAGYFDAAADSKPLLHTWSLGVEEQFYLIFPLLLLLLRRLGNYALLLALFAVLVVSLALSIWAVSHAPTTGFYMIPMRMWELMIGGILAIAALTPATKAVAYTAQIAGLAMIVSAVILFNSDTPFPGYTALLPCLGAGLVIYAGANPEVAQRSVLSLPPFVGIGLISYSLYLWHWPIFVFAKYRMMDDPGAVATCALIGLSLAMGYLSWRYVERPFRGREGWLTRPALFRVAGVCIVGIAVLSAALVALHGLPQRYDATTRAILAQVNDHEPMRTRCFNDARSAGVREFCVIGDPSAKPSFILWGDSHADAAMPAVQAVMAKRRRAGYFAASQACQPVVKPGPCEKFNEAALRKAMAPGISEVILTARWSGYREIAIEQTVSALQGKKIVVIASTPEVDFPVPSMLARVRLFGSHRNIEPRTADFAKREKTANAILQRLKGVTVVYPGDALCDREHCQLSLNGRSLYVDAHHLSIYGAMQLVPVLEPAL